MEQRDIRYQRFVLANTASHRSPRSIGRQSSIVTTIISRVADPQGSRTSFSGE